ncbi:hypothetical protein GW17_00027926 [Ensete ventricosum]|nr:hypothetical protein GW17_00027926 [Ensete ventricosum]
MRMLVHRRLGQLRDVGDNDLDHLGQRSDLLGEIEKCLGCHDGRLEAWRDGRESGVWGSKPRVIEQPPITIRCGCKVDGKTWVDPPGCFVFGLLVGRSCDIGPPSSAKNVTKLSVVRVRKSANVSGDRDFLCGLTLPRWSSS